MKITTLISALFALGFTASAVAQQMNFQGRLTDNTGAPRPGPQTTLTFSIWDAATDGTQVWGDVQVNADLIDGRFSVKLGDATGDDGNGNLLSESFGGPRYIQIQVGSEAPLPRQQLLDTPKAFTANSLSDSSQVIAYARNNFFEVPGSSILGNSFAPNTAQANTLNFLSGVNASGATNGLTFWENSAFGMSFGYDGTGAGNTNALRFYSDDESPVLTIENGGEVGIGTTTPAAPLDVAGSALFDGFTSDGNGRVNGGFSLNAGLPSNVSFQISERAGDHFAFWIEDETGAEMLTLQTVTGNNQLRLWQGQAYKPGGGSWADVSDRRLKKNIHDMTGALEEISRLRPVTFEYKEPEKFGVSGIRNGFIAQEVEEVFPDWISEIHVPAENSDGATFKAVGSNGFESLAVCAIKELRTEKDSQLSNLAASMESANKSLQEENAALKAQLTALEAKFGELAQAIETIKAPAKEAQPVSVVN